MTSSSGPLYRDPIEDGAADPKVIWNRAENAWWMVYTARRAHAPELGVGWVHGTGLGVASSTDHGQSWTYRGQLEGLDTQWGTNTFWAPEIVDVDGIYHMYVSYIRGVPDYWPGPARNIRHYTSDDLVTWTFESTLVLSSDAVIDASVRALPEGGFRLWYKDEADDNNIWAADSDDLYTWKVVGPVLQVPYPVEGPDVFTLDGWHWMIVDAKCQQLYRSPDMAQWELVDTFLDIPSGTRSGRTDDLGPGLHGSVVVAGDSAWLFYFTHPGRWQPDLVAADHRRSSIQVAQLRADAGTITCARDSSVMIDLSAAEG